MTLKLIRVFVIVACKLIIRLFEEKEDEFPFNFGDSEDLVSPQQFTNLSFTDEFVYETKVFKRMSLPTETKVQKRLSLPTETKIQKKMSLCIPPRYPEEIVFRRKSNPTG